MKINSREMALLASKMGLPKDISAEDFAKELGGSTDGNAANAANASAEDQYPADWVRPRKHAPQPGRVHNVGGEAT
jgi:hypothetical protein